MTIKNQKNSDLWLNSDFIDALVLQASHSISARTDTKIYHSTTEPSLFSDTTSSFREEITREIYEALMPDSQSILKESLWTAETVKSLIFNIADVDNYYRSGTGKYNWRDFLPRITRYVKEAKLFQPVFVSVANLPLELAKLFYILGRPYILLN
ncbi:MAG TPA: hypothetical protein VHQ41_00200 [Patescibacteria group bacterium]|jgi:hypothetical protein|nr:hypothetical protein [Patescibacteria group bacterium]